jgi:hypothetical protein
MATSLADRQLQDIEGDVRTIDPGRKADRRGPTVDKSLLAFGMRVADIQTRWAKVSDWP